MWEAKGIDGSRPAWSVSLIIPKSDKETLAKIEKAIQAAYEEGASVLKGTGKTVPPLSAINNPLNDGDEKRSGDPAYQDAYYLNAKNYQRAPGIVDKKCRYKILGYQIEFEKKPLYVFDLNAYKIFKERPKKGEEEDGIEVEVSPEDRKGYFPDDIANTFGVPIEEHKREMEVTERDGLVSIGVLTSPRRE